VISAGQYAVDSTGFSTAVYDRWFSQKHGRLCSQNAWSKLHIMVDTGTHAVTSALVTPEGDCPQMPALLANTIKHVRNQRDRRLRRTILSTRVRESKSCGVCMCVVVSEVCGGRRIRNGRRAVIMRANA